MEGFGPVDSLAGQPLYPMLPDFRSLEVPRQSGDFFVANQDAPLGKIPRTPEEICTADHTDYLQHESFAKYMRMHKVLVGRGGAEELEDIHDGLKNEMAPRFLIAAGWAAAEIALVRKDLRTSRRLELLESASNAWQVAMHNDAVLELFTANEKVEHGSRHRVALNLAVLPLLAGIVEGDVTKRVCSNVFEECLDIGRKNAQDLARMALAGNNDGIAGHVGIGYESNAILAFNRKLSRTWFAIPSTARSDTGYHHRKQTHDLLIIHQDYGNIVRATPVEIKAKASLRDRLRYDALLVRGRMHLSVEGKQMPQYTLQAIDAVYRGVATDEDRMIADNATDRLVSMVRDYYAGEKLGSLATWHTVTTFQDNSQVIARHPGLSRQPILAQQR